MATKLKNISHKKTARLIAFMLALVLFLSSGYFTSMFVKGYFAYNSFDGRPFTQTAAFRESLNAIERIALYDGQTMIINDISDFEKTVEGQMIKNNFDAMKQTAAKSYDLLDSSGIGIYVTAENYYRYRLEHNGSLYYFTYNGELIDAAEFNSYVYIRSNEEATDAQGDSIVVPEETVIQPSVLPVYAPPENAEEFSTAVTYDTINQADVSYIYRIRDALAFIYNSGFDGYNLNYGEISKDAFLQKIEDSCRAELNTQYYNAVNSQESHLLARMSSIKYAVLFKGSGEILTNADINTNDKREAIVTKLGGELLEGLENGKYFSEQTAHKKATGAAAEFYYDVIEPEYESRLVFSAAALNDKVEWAYFSYNPDASDGSDSFEVSEKLYNTHVQKKSASLNSYISAAVILFVLACAIGIWLIATAGKTENGGSEICFFDKIPFEINLAAGILLMFCFMAVAFELGYCELFPSYLMRLGDFSVSVAKLIGAHSSSITAFAVAGFFAIPTVILMSVARNIRAKSFFRHTLCRILFIPFVKLFKKIKSGFAKIKYIFTADYSKGKTKKFRVVACVSITAFFAVNILLYALGYAFGDEAGAFMIVVAAILDIAAIFACALIIISLDRIMANVSDIRHGSVNTKISTEHMPLFLRNFSDDITSIGDGLRDAVDSAVKDQRMKAELITNVSHDLKTPLTSIVSYVDLLKRCNVESEDAKKYITILDEKSQRMKKLIEDLVEASKASSGAMEIHPIKLNLCEFATQAVGEHEDELKSHGIDVVLSLPEKPVYAMADPMKTSRILENLFSNIRKYALEGTRVYAEVGENGSFAVLTIKNVSRNALNVPADELMRRFVRGDSSRTGEGSGLGLSIAKNLCELQGGRFTIGVDGDLFKAFTELPKA